MRYYNISSILVSPTPGLPSIIQLSNAHGDVTASFHGKEWIDGSLTRYPYYTYDTDPLSPTPPPPAGTTLLVATTFEITGNTNGKFDGKYTTYTRASISDPVSSEFSAGYTNVRINEVLATDGTIPELTSGVVTHISTYVIPMVGESSLLVLEQQDYTTRPQELVGRLSAGWGEVITQNILRQAQSFAGSTAPLLPYLGQLWYNTTNSVMYVCSNPVGPVWSVLNSSVYDPYVHTQTVASTAWIVTHNFGLASPYIADATFFVSIGAAYKPIIPSDVSFDSANQLTVTFSTAQSGYAFVRRGPLGGV